MHRKVSLLAMAALAVILWAIAMMGVATAFAGGPGMTVDLQASVKWDGPVLVITNQDPFDWHDVLITINCGRIMRENRVVALDGYDVPLKPVVSASSVIRVRATEFHGYEDTPLKLTKNKPCSLTIFARESGISFHLVGKSWVVSDLWNDSHWPSTHITYRTAGCCGQK